MANEANLRPPYSPSEAREYGKMGGIKSGESKRQKKLLRETVECILDQPITDEAMISKAKSDGVPLSDHPTCREFVVASIIISSAKHGRMSDLLSLEQLLGEGQADLLAENQDEYLAKVEFILGQVPSVID